MPYHYSGPFETDSHTEKRPGTGSHIGRWNAILLLLFPLRRPSYKEDSLDAGAAECHVPSAIASPLFVAAGHVPGRACIESIAVSMVSSCATAKTVRKVELLVAYAERHGTMATSRKRPVHGKNCLEDKTVGGTY
jgi:hypothetical protein